MSSGKNKLVPHELRPANTAQSTIENNRLTQELKKLERDKNINISRLTASQAVLQKGLRKMVTGGQHSAQDGQEGALTAPSPAPSSVLNPNTGATSRQRLVERASPRSSSRINVHMADPDVLATTSTKSFHGQIIGGQAQRQRKLDSRGNLRPAPSSVVGSSVSQLTRSSMGVIMDGSLYNVPEMGAGTGIEFTEEDVDHGVRDRQPGSREEATSSGGPPSGAAQPAQNGTETPPAPEALLSALGGAEATQPAQDGAEAPAAGHGAEAVSEASAGDNDGIKLVVPVLPRTNELNSPADLVAPEQGQTADSPSQPGQSVAPSDSNAASVAENTFQVQAEALGPASRTSKTTAGAASSIATPLVPLLPDTISQQAYMRAVERAFAAKCLKHSKFVTDLEMRQFVLQFLLVEQQNENFKRANEFVDQIVDSKVEL